MTDGEVDAVALSGSTLYLGGRFSRVGPATGCGVPLATSTGTAASGFPRVDGPVYAAVPDGSGGWFIGGDFDAVGDSARSNLAHVLVGQQRRPLERRHRRAGARPRARRDHALRGG